MSLGLTQYLRLLSPTCTDHFLDWTLGRSVLPDTIEGLRLPILPFISRETMFVPFIQNPVRFFPDNHIHFSTR
jgi:hypothetical protein